MKDRGLKLILDFVPNHSSIEHEWFVKSVNREEPFTDFYVWKKGKNGKNEEPPNNRVCIALTNIVYLPLTYYTLNMWAHTTY